MQVHIPKRTNPDGSRNIHCPKCRNFILTINSHETFGSAICIVCQYAERGEVIPDEIVQLLRSRQIGDKFVPLAIAEPKLSPDPLIAMGGSDIPENRVAYYVRTVARAGIKVKNK